MPRKPFSGAPMHQKGKMSDETRKKVYGTEKDTAPADREGWQERQRQYSGASEHGTPDSKGADKHS